MKWLFIVSSANTSKGGAVIAPMIIKDVITEFRKARVDLIFFKKTNFLNLLFNLDFSKPNIEEFDKSSFIEVSSLIQLLYWLIRNTKNYNLFVLHGIWSPIYILSSLFLIIFKKPFCFHPHGSLDPFDINKKKKFLKNLLGILFYNRILKFSLGIIFTSKLESERSKTFGAKPPKYVAILSSPIKEVGEKLNNNQLRNLRDKYQINENQKILLFLSRIDSKKGLDIILKSLKFINQEKYPTVLLVAGLGDYDYRKKISNLINTLKIESYVRILGHVRGGQKLEILKISDLFVLPSLNENFGIAIVESIQNKLPVLITKEVYIHEKIIKAKAGYLCNRDPLELSNLIIKILNIPNIEEIESYTQNCFKKYFSREICAEEHYKIYSKLSRIR